MRTDTQALVVAAGDGREIRFGPNRLSVKVGPESGAHRFGVFESVFPPGAGTFVHRHRLYDEAFYVLEGEIEYRLDDQRVTALPGLTVFKTVAADWPAYMPIPLESSARARRYPTQLSGGRP